MVSGVEVRGVVGRRIGVFVNSFGGFMGTDSLPVIILRWSCQAVRGLRT